MKPMNHFGCVVTKDERYVIIMADLGDNKDFDDMAVLDLKQIKVFECDMIFPHNRICRAVIMEDKDGNELLFHGFVNREMKKYDVDIPDELFLLILCWYSNEFVHVVSEYGKHWNINVDKIINSIK